MSKKEIRRAAREAYPKAKNASAGRRRGNSGASSKRTNTAATRSAGGKAAPKPPSVKRSFIIAAFMAAFYFVLIQWVFHFAATNTYSNAIVAFVGLFIFAGVNYLMDRVRYRRYVNKQKGLGK